MKTFFRGPLRRSSARIQIYLYPQTSYCSYALFPYVSDENAHSSRKLLKTVSRVKTFQNATKPHTCESPQTFENDDVRVRKSPTHVERCHGGRVNSFINACSISDSNILNVEFGSDSDTCGRSKT